jgi:methylphosphotriester-DNA--protein-cysteine methyltransferase
VFQTLNARYEPSQRSPSQECEAQPSTVDCGKCKRSPAFIVHRWIRRNHGHTKLCFGDMARCLELDLRTLQRVFHAAYGTSMKSYATYMRVRYVSNTLKSCPNTKLSALGSELGYESDKAFIRFLSQHLSKTPMSHHNVCLHPPSSEDPHGQSTCTACPSRPTRSTVPLLSNSASPAEAIPW